MNRLADILRSADNIAILTHKRPDGDTIGSAAALCRALRALGKTAYIMPDAGITVRLGEMTEGLIAPEGFSAEFVVGVDFGDISRAAPEYSEWPLDVVIDHHGTSTNVPVGSVVEPKAAATGELVYRLIAELGVELDCEMAKAIYTAVATDTGCFRFSNTTAETHLVAAAAMEAGAPIREINNAYFAVKTRGRIAVEALVRSKTQFFFDGKMSVCALEREEERAASTNEDDFDNLANLIKDIEGVAVGAMLREMDDGKVRVSLRTSEPIDASEVCAVFGGGGHKRAAGFTSGKDLCGTVEDLKNIIGSRLG